MRTLTSYVATKTGRDIHLQSSYLPLPPSQSPLSSGHNPPSSTHHPPPPLCWSGWLSVCPSEHGTVMWAGVQQ